MSYREKPLLKIYKYENSAFILKAIIDDYATCSFQRNKYSAGQFSIQINFNIPNSQIFEKGLFIQFGNDEKDFGVITDVKDVIGESGKGSQTRTITGYDGRYILQRRIVKNLNNNENWTYTGKGENCIRKLINSQCGSEAEAERRLPIINNIPEEENAIGNQYTVAEAYSNLLSVCETIATQSEVGWGIKFNGNLELYFYSGEDLSENVKFTTDYDSLRSGNFSDSLKSYCNAIYIGGKGNGSERDIYLGTDGNPSGLDRFEGWDNQSSLTEETEYEAEANSMLSQYGQTISLTGQGLAKCPYEYKKQYDVGDIITVGFSGKSAKVQILSVTENWQWGSYNIDFEFGKPIIDLSTQLKMILKQIQVASSSTESKYTDSIKYYTIPSDTEMADGDVAFSTIGFKGNFGSGATFKLKYNTSGTGSKNYHIYINQTTGSGKLTLTTGVAGASNLTLSSGTYVQLVYVDSNGNIKNGLALDDTTTSGSTSWSSEKTQNEINKSALASYPIGSLYWTENKDFNPNTSFGGTWERIKDKFIYAYGDGSDALGTQAGSNTVTLSSSNLPKHTHTLNNHSHTINHDHAAFTTASGGSHSHADGNFKTYNCQYFDNKPNPGYALAVANNSHRGAQVVVNGALISGGGAHTHSIDVPSYSGSSGGPNNNNTSDGNFANTAFSVMPAYERAYCWKRTA